jgi:hypothetical protein
MSLSPAHYSHMPTRRAPPRHQRPCRPLPLCRPHHQSSRAGRHPHCWSLVPCAGSGAGNMEPNIFCIMSGITQPVVGYIPDSLLVAHQPVKVCGVLYDCRSLLPLLTHLYAPLRASDPSRPSSSSYSYSCRHQGCYVLSQPAEEYLGDYVSLGCGPSLHCLKAR